MPHPDHHCKYICILYSRGMGTHTTSETRDQPRHERRVERGRNFQIYLRPSLIDKIDAEARRRGVSRSSMIAAWIERAKWGG